VNFRMVIRLFASGAESRERKVFEARIAIICTQVKQGGVRALPVSRRADRHRYSGMLQESRAFIGACLKVIKMRADVAVDFDQWLRIPALFPSCQAQRQG